MDLVGRTLAHFRIEAKLGQGGMGVVYLATDEHLRRKVAIKVLPESFARDEERRKRFLREARSAAAVTHANIATIHEIGEADGQVFIAMELIEGETLRARMQAGTAVAECVRIAREIAAGLRRAHERGIVHRDLKPENVMIGAHDEVKILDFGLAKVHEDHAAAGSALEQGETATGLTGEGRVLGTPGYMSPEQARGKEVDARTDVFALGVVLYELLTGKPPFVGETMADALSAVIRDTPAPPSSLQPQVPEELDRIVLRCLEKSPDARYANAEPLYEALGGHVANARAAGPSAGTVHPAGVGAAPGSLLTPPASTAAAVRPAAWRWPLLGLASLVVVALMVFAVVQAKRSGVRTALDPAPVSGNAAPEAGAAHGVPVTALPTPASASPEAVAAYQAGLAGLRGADWDLALRSFHRAVELDSGLAAAGVQLCLMQPNAGGDVDAARRLYRRTVAQELTLTARDRAILEAVEPGLMREPSDDAEMRVRMNSTRDRFPQDAEIAFFAAVFDRSDLASTIVAMDHVLALDPAYADAMQERARALYRLGRTEEGLAQLDACVKVAPGSQCVDDRVSIVLQTGDCSAAATLARDYVASSAGEADAYEDLVEAIAGGDSTDDAVLEAIRQQTAHGGAAVQEFLGDITRTTEECELDVLRGRFDQAESRARQLMLSVEKSPDLPPHVTAARLLMEILSEQRRTDEAVRIGRAFLARRSVWNHGASLDDATPVVLDILDEAGALSHEDTVRQVASWHETEVGRRSFGSGGVDRRARILASMIVRSPDEASASLDGISLVGGTASSEATVTALAGRALLLAGRPEAEPTLERAARSCSGLLEPFIWVRAHLWLGQAREKRGDSAGACGAYRAVLSHWAQRPYVRTAAVAAARVDALHCP
jgi:serine/threonine-protein kinase